MNYRRAVGVILCCVAIAGAATSYWWSSRAEQKAKPITWVTESQGEMKAPSYAQIFSLNQYPKEIQQEVNNAFAAYRGGDFNVAIRLMRNLLREEASVCELNGKVKYHLAWALFNNGENREAEKVVEEILLAYPNEEFCTAVRVLKARLLKEAGSRSEAENLYRQIAAEKPANPYWQDVAKYELGTFNPLFEAANAAYRDEKYFEAHKNFLRYAEENPESLLAPMALYLAGRCKEKLGDNYAAEVLYQRVIQQYPRANAANSAQVRCEYIKEKVR